MRVLVVDDNMANRKVAAALLARAGHIVTCVDGGQSAIEACHRVTFDIILMDIEMPGMNGLQATAQIRRHLGEATPLIFALTAHASASDRQTYRIHGLDGTIAKPFTLDALNLVLADANVMTSILREFDPMTNPDILRSYRKDVLTLLPKIVGGTPTERFRAIHSLTGLAATMGLDDVSERVGQLGIRPSASDLRALIESVRATL